MTGRGEGKDAVGLEARLGHRFRDPALLQRALTHSSLANETGDSDNEALEFLGDAALGFFVAGELLRRFPEMDEGGLSKLKAFVVSGPNLARVARTLDLGGAIRLGGAARGEVARDRDSLLSDALEAVIAAVLLDGGEEAARALVGRLFGPQIAGLRRADVETGDHKTALQELLQGQGRPTPEYRVIATEGPPHAPVFQVAAVVEGKTIATGRGGSKKAAEQEAARRGISVLRPPEE